MILSSELDSTPFGRMAIHPRTEVRGTQSGFKARDKEDKFIDESFKPGKVIVAPVKDCDVTEVLWNTGGNGCFVDSPFGHGHEGRQIAGMVKFGVEFNGAFDGAELGPII
jgi:hypothetical protein